MIGIKDIASYVPKTTMSNLDLLDQFNIDDSFIRDKIGVIHRCIKSDTETTSDMASKALTRLLENNSLKSDEIQTLVLVTQNPDSNIPHSSALVHSKCSLSSNCAVFDLSLGCSGYVYGLSVLQNFLQGNGLKTGVLLTCDPYSNIIDKSDKNTSLLFGDAATATLLCDKPLFSIGPTLFGSFGQSSQAIVCKDSQLHMKGRDVFNFAAKTIPSHVMTLLERSDLSLEDIDKFFFHQGSRFIVETIAKRLNLELSKVPINLDNIGNTVSSSIPLLLEDSINCNEFPRSLLCGFGVGLSWASCLLFPES